MATTVIEKGQPGSRAHFRDSFVLHKLMSLTGLFPIGFFMIQHLIANSYSLRGRTEFNTVVSVFGYLPFVAVLEWAIVFIPLLFHAIYGLFIVAEMQGPGGNTNYYNYGRNWLYGSRERRKTPILRGPLPPPIQAAWKSVFLFRRKMWPP